MKTILISGCAGFIGCNLIERLIVENKIIGIDNFYSSSKHKLSGFMNNKNFKFIESDINTITSIDEKIDVIYNLACPASPPRYQSAPIFTLKTNFIGTINLLDLAKKNSSIFIQASTSEVYGDPLVHPQNENYSGNVVTMGPRSCYDEGKRVAETLCYEYRRNFNVQTRVLRIFNTYGPYMDIDDGRVISNFLVNVIKNKPLEIYGDGTQTRSFCYIDDLINGLIMASRIDFDIPINLGNDTEISLNNLARTLQDMFKKTEINYKEGIEDDPKMRRPDINRAKEILNWSPNVSLEEGLRLTIDYFKNQIVFS